MTEIKYLNIGRLRQEEAYGFHELMKDETAKFTDPKIASLQVVYDLSFLEFDKAIKPGGKSVLTQKINQLDTQRDQLFQSFRKYAYSMLGHFDPDTAEMARRACIVIDKYGDVTPLPFLEESGKIDNLIQDLRALDDAGGDEIPEIELAAVASDLLTAIGLKAWVDQLEVVNNEFKAAFAERNAANSTIVTGLSTQTRKAVDQAYNDLVRRVNALIEVNGDAGYLSVVVKMNELIDYQHTTLAARSTRNAKKNENDDDRPVVE